MARKDGGKYNHKKYTGTSDVCQQFLCNNFVYANSPVWCYTPTHITSTHYSLELSLFKQIFSIIYMHIVTFLKIFIYSNELYFCQR